VPIIDAYGHVSLPRFLSAEDFLRVMDTHDVAAAVLSTADTCPDAQELSRALVSYPDRFRVIGIPLGADAAGRRDNIRRQLDSGFSGIRLPATLIAAQPDLLEVIGDAGGCIIAVGDRGLHAAAREIAGFLDRYDRSFAIAGHFGGPTDPALLDTDAAVARLFAHPRLHVAFTRHGAMAHLPVEHWAQALLARIGWQRALWGSEWPVALWRDETYASTLDWALRLAPDAAQLAAFRYGNAQRLFFAAGAAHARKIDPDMDLMTFRKPADVWLFPPSLNVSEARHRALYHAYVAWGGEARGAYSEFFLQMAERGIRAV
jgi:hypothetical protein